MAKNYGAIVRVDPAPPSESGLESDISHNGDHDHDRDHDRDHLSSGYSSRSTSPSPKSKPKTSKPSQPQRKPKPTPLPLSPPLAPAPGSGERTPLLSGFNNLSNALSSNFNLPDFSNFDWTSFDFGLPTPPELDELTAAERREYERGLLTWDRASNWRFWVRREWTPWYVLGAVLVAGVSLVMVFHRQIITSLMPFVHDARGSPFGWVIPIAVIAVLSFPPLFGNEIVLILTGVVWGIKGGAAIVAAGTVIGELGSFTVFRTCCSKRARRFSRQSLNYACLSRVIEEGGLFVAWIVRLSAIPTHVSTAIFAVCGLDYPRFLAALVLSLPKQFIAVYVGVIVMDEDAGDEDRILSDVVLGVTIVITLLALWNIHKRMLRVRKQVFLEAREDLRSRGVMEPPPPSTPMPEPACPV